MAVVKQFQTREEFRRFCKTLTTQKREKLMEEASKVVSWKRSDDFRINWMRCAMAIGEEINKGKVITLLVDQEIKGKRVTNTNPKTENKMDPGSNTLGSMKSLADKLGIEYSESADGSIILGKGYNEAQNRFGYMSAVPGHIRMRHVFYDRAWGGYYVLLDSAFEDKDLIKNQLNGRFNPDSKSWYIPFSQILDAIKLFKNVEIYYPIVPLVKRVIEKIDIDKIDVEVMKYKREKYEFKMPRGMMEGLRLYKHQKSGVEFLLNQRRAVLGMAVGLGKTLTAITAGKELLNRKKVERILVISPVNVKYNWKEEIEKFGNEKVAVLNSGDLRKKTAEDYWEDAENSTFIVVNFDMIRKQEVAKRLQKLCPDAVIVDEAHKLKNSSSQQTKAFKKFWKDAEYIWLLTATPFPNAQPKETYTMLNHINPGITGTWREFGKNFVVFEEVSTPYGIKQVPVRLKNTDKLKEAMKKAVFIRNHNSPDVSSELPKERHYTYKLEMTPKQKRLYAQQLKALKGELEKAEKERLKFSSNILAALTRLEQIAMDPDLLLDNEEEIDIKNLSPKEEWAVNAITAHLENAENGGIVVFCDMKLPLQKIYHNLVLNKAAKAQELAFITGEVKSEDRQEISRRFNEGQIKVILATSAGEEGINLQKGGNTMIMLDTPWTPKSITQRQGRILRQGQTDGHCVFLTPVMEGTIEERKREKVMSKVTGIEELLGEGSTGSAKGSVKSVSVEDIRDLLL